jgi:hypothetical protein
MNERKKNPDAVKQKHEKENVKRERVELRKMTKIEAGC